MSTTDPGWAWFEPAPAATDDQRQTLARAFARVFSAPDAPLVLAHLRALTVERSLGPDASDAALRYLEGQRMLVQHILSLIERGRADPTSY